LNGENIRKGVRYDTNDAFSSYTYETVLKVLNLQQIEGWVMYYLRIYIIFFIILIIRYYSYKTPIIRKPIQYNGISLYDYMSNKTEFIPSGKWRKFYGMIINI